MMFMELDHGAILRKETGRETPKIVRFLIGNPLIMKEMVKHVPDAGSYAPVAILVDERPEGVHFCVRQDGESSGPLHPDGWQPCDRSEPGLFARAGRAAEAAWPCLSRGE